jgi:hypothetical protein
MIQSRSRRLLVAAMATALSAAVVYAPSAQAAAHRWTVDVGEVPVTVEAVYPAVTVPSDTNLLRITLPGEFDWLVGGPDGSAPKVTWSIQSGDAVVGAPAEPDEGTLGTFGATGAVDFSTLPTDLTDGLAYTLRIHGVWDDPLAPKTIVDLVTPFVVTPAETGVDVLFNLGFTEATDETRTIDATLDGRANAGDSVYLTTETAETKWNWLDGPDAANPWTSRTQVFGGLGVGVTDPAAPDQTIGGPFSVSTPDPTMLVAPLPDVVYAGVTTMALSVSSQEPPAAGPRVTVRVNVGMTFASGTSALAAWPRPVISGTAVFGNTLSVSPGTWAPVTTGGWTTAVPVPGFQWYRGSSAIAGATTRTHVLATADVGTVLTVRVTASSPGYVTTTVATAGVTVKPATAPRATVRPTLAGTATVGHGLSVRRGTWTSSPTSYRYQWLRDGVAIRGAVATTYRLPASMRGHLISCRVSALRAGYATGLATTAAARVR